MAEERQAYTTTEDVNRPPHCWRRLTRRATQVPKIAILFCVRNYARRPLRIRKGLTHAPCIYPLVLHVWGAWLLGQR